MEVYMDPLGSGLLYKVSVFLCFFRVLGIGVVERIQRLLKAFGALLSLIVLVACI